MADENNIPRDRESTPAEEAIEYADALRAKLNRTRKEAAEAVHEAEVELEKALAALRFALIAPEERENTVASPLR